MFMPKCLRGVSSARNPKKPRMSRADLAAMESKLVDREMELTKKERRLRDMEARLEEEMGQASTVDPAAIARKAVLARRAEAWQHHITRKYWLLTGEMPASCDLQVGELRDILLDVPLEVSQQVIDQIGVIAGFQVESYQPRPAPSSPVMVSQQLRLLADALLKVVGKGVRSPEGFVSMLSAQGSGRLSELHEAFTRGVNTVSLHETLWLGRRREVHGKLVLLVNDGLSKWTAALFNASVAAGQKWSVPPDVADFPPVVVPTWESLNAYIALGKLGNGEFHRK